MEIKVGKLSGFCNGVNYAVSHAYLSTENSKNVYCLGEIVHNEKVVADLKEKGIIFVNDLDLIPNNSKVIFRAHGESIDTYKRAYDKNIEIIDLTCPKVKLIHQKIENKNDSYILLIGKKNHPESIASISYSKDGKIIESENDLFNLKDEINKLKYKKIYVLSQTTISNLKYNELLSKIKDIFGDFIITQDNTICNATSLRQEETINISKTSNKMIIIGGKNSSNTKELFNLSNLYCSDCYLIQDINDLENINFTKDDIVGVVAGASTPKVIIDEIVDYLENLYQKKKSLNI